MTYNLIVEGGSTVAEAPAANLVRAIQEFFTHSGPARRSGDRNAQHPPDRLVYLLDHEYTQQGLQWSRLKNADTRRAAALRAAATILDCEIFLALADIHETWSCEEEYSGYSDYGSRFYGDDADGDERDEEGIAGGSSDPDLTELLDSDVELRHWVGTGGQSEGVSAPVDAAELCFTKPSTDFEPFESEHEGYMGNYGNTVEHWYHRAAVVLWPRERTFVIRAKASPRWGIREIAKALKARNPTAAISMAQRLLLFWTHAAARTETPALLGATVKVAAKLGDPSLAAALLQPFALTALTPKVAPGLAGLLDSYGIDWCRALLQTWASEENHEPTQTRPSWIGSTLAVLCRTLCAGDPSAGRGLAGWILTEQWAWLLDRSKQMQQHLFGKDVMRELVSLCKPILGIIEGSRVTQQPDLQARVIEFLTSDDADLPVQVPMGVLRSAREHHQPSKLKSWGLRPVHAHCSQVITARLNRPARANNDWSIQTWIRCACPPCQTLTQYVRAPDKVRFEWPLVKDRRLHIHRTIDSFNLPITHTTRRKGRLFTLVLEKTTALFERDTAERLSWQQELQWLNKTNADF